MKTLCIRLGLWLLITLSFTYTAYALVVGPIIAISALKLSVFLISGLSMPIIVLFQMFGKSKRLKVFALSLIVLAIIFAAAYTFFSIKNTISPNRRYEDAPNTAQYNIMPFDGAPAPRTLNEDKVRSIVQNPYIKSYSVKNMTRTIGELTLGMSFIFALPVFVLMLFVNVNKKMFNNLEFFIVWLFSNYAVSFLAAFTVFCITVYS